MIKKAKNKIYKNISGDPTLNDSIHDLELSQDVYKKCIVSKNMLKEESWLTPFLHQGINTDLSHGYSYLKIIQLINDGKLFMKMISVSDWAEKDIKYKENEENLNLSGTISVNVYKPTPHGCDGEITLEEDITFLKLTLDDSEINGILDNDDSHLIIPKGTVFPLEIGNQSINKTHMQIHMGGLARLPYKKGLIRGLSPMVALFFNSEEFKGI